ncbi:GTPase ObgE [Candidatus Acetothermia bacterium]|jgi:GTP-binding protein|nr:GTPase ObgE [Candidatus Acetothermia bacterium]MCI2436833.1 GTPase ObgE [Candidatus Acetothermia bacterium]
MFIDEAKICVVGGRGGDGIIGFLREKYRPKGGPDGGDGGRGGSVILRADPHLNTLLKFKHQIHFKAPHGQPGGKNNRYGADGQDLMVSVPVGTVVKALHTGEVLADLSVAGQELIITRGGEGGRGNVHFKSSTRQAPRIRERGAPGEERWLKLELKLIADVGIIGFPNAGKSSLIAKISAARPKIAPYPFTTLTPNLGVVRVEEFQEFVIVDVPGLIEGAHEGKGLGDRFLKHIERTRLLVHLIDLAPTDDARDPVKDYEIINNELRSFSPVLAEKVQIVVGNKIDMLEKGQREAIRARFSERKISLRLISALTGEGTRELIYECYQKLQELKAAQPRAPLSETEDVKRRIYTFSGGPEWEIDFQDNVFVLSGRAVERLSRLSLEERDAQEYLYERLEALGVMAELRRRGLREGSAIRLGEYELVYSEK